MSSIKVLGTGNVAVDSSDNVYAVGNNRVQKFDSNVNFITEWGSYGDGDGGDDTISNGTGS